MTPEDINQSLTELFGQAVQLLAPGSWQVETNSFRLLVLLSEDSSWLRLLIPILSAKDALPFTEQLLEANFDATQESRYALNQGVLWGVYQHSLSGLTQTDFAAAVARLVSLHQKGLSESFEQLVDNRIRTIIRVAKQQGQSVEKTLQTLNRLYEEGVMGEMSQGAESREQVLAAWQRRLEKLWPEVEP